MASQKNVSYGKYATLKILLFLYSKTCQKWPTPKLLTFLKLPFVIKIFVLSIFEWPLKAGFLISEWLKTIRSGQVI